MRMSPALAVSSAALLLLASLAGGLALRLSLASTEKSVVMPRVELTSADGSIAQLPVGDTPLLINFWATWCPPCRREIPLFSEVAGMEGLPYRIIGVAVDDPGPVLAFLRENELGFATFIAGLADGVQLVERLGNAQMAMPYTVLVDRQGKVIRAKLGPFANVAEIVAFAADDGEES